MTTVEVLRAARALVEDPERWHGGERAGRTGGTNYCASTAITYAADGTSGGGCSAEKAFARAVGLEVGHVVHIWTWNDAKSTTHADVLAAFDAAIAASETT